MCYVRVFPRRVFQDDSIDESCGYRWYESILACIDYQMRRLLQIDCFKSFMVLCEKVDAFSSRCMPKSMHTIRTIVKKSFRTLDNDTIAGRLEGLPILADWFIWSFLALSALYLSEYPIPTTPLVLELPKVLDRRFEFDLDARGFELFVGRTELAVLFESP